MSDLAGMIPGMNPEAMFPEIASLGPEDRIRTAEELEAIALALRASVRPLKQSDESDPLEGWAFAA